MQKIVSFFKNEKLFWLWALALAALFGYSMYSFRYEFLDWSNLPLVGLYAGLSGVCFALTFLLLLRKGGIKGMLGFFGALAVFEGVLWGVLTLVNVGGQYNQRAVHAASAAVFTLYAVVMLLAFLRLAKTIYKPFYRVLAALLCIGFLCAAALPVLPTPREVYMHLDYTSRLSFDPLPASALRGTGEETDAARAFFDSRVMFTGEGAPAFDFLLNGEPFSAQTQDWDYSVGEARTPPRRGGETLVLTAKHRENGLKLTVEGTFYAPYATAEWTVYLENEGAADSPVISNLYALTQLSLPGLAAPQLYCACGSHDAAEDFTLYRVKNAAKKHTFAGVEGRPSDAWMPFFNLCGENGGAVLGVGWTGQWQADIACKGETAAFNVRQQTLKAYLRPGESLRSPLVSLTFYGGGNPVKGFNRFRSWLLGCVYRENTPTVLNDLDVLFVSHTRTAEEILRDAATYSDALLSRVDNFWMDAGWYDGCVDDWSDGNGNWVTNEARFPNGIKEISSLAASKGAGLVLWYEPERLVHGSRLYAVGQENPRYIIDLAPQDAHNTRILWNLAEEGACKYLTDYIASSLIENGVSVYRQDFNISPLKFWEYADAHYYGGRKGYCENKYVTNLYKYLDGLFAAVPGLLLDNCASGGRRLDLEMTRRGVPLWRSDYNCAVHPDSAEATQAHTYGLSFWQPINGVNVDLYSEYGARSSIFCGNLFTSDSGDCPYFGAYDAERALLIKPFFPISFGGVEPGGITAMQYGDELSGMALIYKHEKAKPGAFAVPLSALEPQRAYRVWDVDSPAAVSMLSGEALLRGEFTVTLPEGKKAVIVRYEAQD